MDKTFLWRLISQKDTDYKCCDVESRYSFENHVREEKVGQKFCFLWLFLILVSKVSLLMMIISPSLYPTHWRSYILSLSLSHSLFLSLTLSPSLFSSVDRYRPNMASVAFPIPAFGSKFLLIGQNFHLNVPFSSLSLNPALSLSLSRSSHSTT